MSGFWQCGKARSRLTTRLEKTVKNAKTPAAACAAITKLHRQIWNECRKNHPTKFPGDIYGEALEVAGFESHDRYRMASFPVSGSTEIVTRILGMMR